MNEFETHKSRLNQPTLPQRLTRLFLVGLRRLQARVGHFFAISAAFILVMGPLAFLREAHVQNIEGMTWHEALYATLGLFTFASNRVGYPHWLPLRLVYFGAPLLAASAIVGAFFRLVAERSSLFLGTFSGHMVIGGLGNLGVTLARHLEKHRHAVIAIERRGDLPAVAEMRAAGASIVVVGDMTSPAVLKRARCTQAAHVFFVSQSDVANLDAAFQVRRLVEHSPVRHPPTIYAHVYDTGLVDSLAGQIHHHDHAVQAVQIVPFNSYRFAAKALIGDLLREHLLTSLRVAPGLRLRRTEWPTVNAPKRPEPSRHRHAEVLEEDSARLVAAFRLEADTGPESAERFVIIGLGRFGRQVLAELLGAAPEAARFLIVERSEADHRLGTGHLTEGEQARCEHFVGDAISAVALDRMMEFRPTAAIICTDNDLSNLRLAFDLRRRDVRAVTRMSGPDAELGHGLDGKGVTLVSLSRLFRASIPILTHERRLQACINLDVNRTADVDHLFYVARVTPAERQRLGRSCFPLSALPATAKISSYVHVPENLCLVWHRAVKDLATSIDD